MAAPVIIFNIFPLLILFIISSAFEVNIQFFKEENFSGLLWESKSIVKCKNVPHYKLADIYSIRTDTCLIVYFNPDCKSQWSMKYLPGDYNISENDLTWIESFQTCNEEEGGIQLNVDIFRFDDSLVADVLQSYKKVCSCVNVPEYVQNMRIWSIDNHHNALLVYFEPDCLDNKIKGKILAAGHNLDSNFMNELRATDNVTEIMYKIMSFGPDPDSLYFQTSCFHFNVPTESTGTYGGKTGGGTDAKIDPNERFQPNSDLNDHFQENFDLDERVSANDLIERYQENINLNKRFQVLSNQFVELQTRFDQSTRKINNFRYGVLRQHKEDYKKLSEKVTELNQGFRNFSEKIKSGLHEMLA